MDKEEIRDKVEDLYIDETNRFAFLDLRKLDDRYVEWLEEKVFDNIVVPASIERNWFQKLPLHWRYTYRLGV